MHFALSDSWIFALCAAPLIVAFAGFAWALLGARRRAGEANAQLATRLDTALVEIRRLSGQLIVLGGSIEALGTRVAQAQAQAQAPAPAPRQAPAAGANPRGYETAIRMARSGASVEEIVASCGTTRAEAKLLRRLHECGDPRKADTEAKKIA